jgi:putative addiction module component (TIGR02574 family)
MRSDELSQEPTAPGLEKKRFCQYTLAMSFTQVLEELPNLTFEERQLLVRRAIDLDEPLMSAADEALVESRFASHHADPGTSIPLEESKARIRSRIRQ